MKSVSEFEWRNKMFNTEKTSQALIIANEAHHGAVRKVSQIPYIYHPLAVAFQILAWGGNENSFMVALLHDVLEDAGAHWAQRIRTSCGKATYRIVCECSNAMPYLGEEKAPWLE